MSVPKISALNLSQLVSPFPPPAIYLCDNLPMYVFVYQFFLFIYFIFYLSLRVSVLPTIRVWQSEVNATADVGQPAMLTCAVDGYPEPMVTWTR